MTLRDRLRQQSRGGTGKFRSYSGRTVGNCFACKGAGKRVFKTSSEARAKARNGAADRKALYKWLVAASGRGFGFAVSLMDALRKYGDLTEGQRAAVERGIARDLAYEAAKAERAKQAAERVATAPAVDTTKLETAFTTAREKATRRGQMGVIVKPIKIQSGDIVVKFTPGSVGSQWEGMLFAKSGDGKKLGHIKGGKFIRKFECSDAEAAAVLDCAADPEKAAIAYGKAWSVCGICGRGLLNDESIERGIGPICAERFGW